MQVISKNKNELSEVKLGGGAPNRPFTTAVEEEETRIQQVCWDTERAVGSPRSRELVGGMGT